MRFEELIKIMWNFASKLQKNTGKKLIPDPDPGVRKAPDPNPQYCLDRLHRLTNSMTREWVLYGHWPVQSYFPVTQTDCIYVYVYLCLCPSMSMCDRSARLVNMAPLVAIGEALHNVPMCVYVYLCLYLSMSISIYVYVRQVSPAGEHGAAGGQRGGSPQCVYVYLCLSMSMSIYIYLYLYLCLYATGQPGWWTWHRWWPTGRLSTMAR